jgi:hypothetical protein
VKGPLEFRHPQTNLGEFSRLPGAGEGLQTSPAPRACLAPVSSGQEASMECKWSLELSLHPDQSFRGSGQSYLMFQEPVDHIEVNLK